MGRNHFQSLRSQHRAHKTIWANLCTELETPHNVVLREADGVIGSSPRALEVGWKGELQHALETADQTPQILPLFWNVIVKPHWTPAANYAGGASEYLKEAANALASMSEHDKRPEPSFRLHPPTPGRNFPCYPAVIKELQKNTPEALVDTLTSDKLLREGVVIDANGGMSCKICDIHLTQEELKQHLHPHYSKGGGQKHQKNRKMAMDFRRQL